MVVQKRVANRDMADSETTYTRRGGSSSISGRKLWQAGDAAEQEAWGGGAVLAGEEERAVDADAGGRDGGDHDPGGPTTTAAVAAAASVPAPSTATKVLWKTWEIERSSSGRRGAMPSKLAVPGG